MRIELYSGMLFFLVAGMASLPAIVLGVMEKRIKYYGLCAGLVLLVLAIGCDVFALAKLFLYFAFQMAIIRLLLYMRSSVERKNLTRVAVLLSVFPLALTKFADAGETKLIGFLGISYMTFKSVQVIIEIGDGLIDEVKACDYLYFITFFPTVMCGPIDRSRRFLADADRPMSRSEYLDNLGNGAFKILLGALLKYVLAGLCVMIGTKQMYVYGLYLYFDFAGYSLMAVGFSYIFGIATPDNFKYPWLSVDVKDFWNRWHITLSTWLRDFLFTRIMMNALKGKWFGANKLMQACFALIVNMFVMGVWHGLESHYIIYGLYHGVLLALTEVYQKKSKFYKKYKKNKYYRFASWLVTVNLVMIGFGIFSGQLL